METTSKPKRHSARVERILKKREPQVIESTKRSLVLKGQHTSEIVVELLKDIAKLSKPNCVTFSKKNKIIPFEDASSLEFFGQKNDCSLFAMGSHTKKRPHNLLLGRTFDGHILDMVEFGVENFQSISSFDGSKKGVGSKPLFLFHGNQWSTDSLYGRIQNLLLDFFRGAKLEMISLQGIDNVIVATVEDGKIYLRVYTVAFKKSGTKVPNVQLIPMGPNVDLTVRRSQLASDDMWKTSLKQPKAAEIAKVKNVSRTSLGDKVGRIHMKKQDIDKLGGRRVTALRGERKKRPEPADSSSSTANPLKRSKSA